jgi:hypothetical protein
MSKATYPLKLPVSLKKEAARLAKQDGVSLNQWIATVETTADFLKRRAGNATGSGLSEILRQVPDREPDPGDELPPNWVSP